MTPVALARRVTDQTDDARALAGDLFIGALFAALALIHLGRRLAS